MASEANKHHMPISHSPCRRRSKGPLPSCLSIHLPISRGFEVVDVLQESLCPRLVGEGAVQVLEVVVALVIEA